MQNMSVCDAGRIRTSDQTVEHAVDDIRLGWVGKQVGRS
jgi:hypothetical protein